MTTAAAFVRTPEPECPYEPRMTRAEAIALRDGGLLFENCVVVVIDGPEIGTPGNTSLTEIELNPTAPDDLGLTARVNTTFDNSAWEGLYDIDLGVAGSIIRLSDNWGNTAVDIDVNSPTVHDQMPWHRPGGFRWRDNYVEDSTLIEMDGATTFTGNTVRESTLDFTGTTASNTLRDNTIRTSGIVVGGSGNLFLNNTEISDSPQAIEHTGSGRVTIQDSRIRDEFRMLFESSQDATIGNTTFESIGAANADADFIHRATGGSLFLHDSRFVGRPQGVAPTFDNRGSGGQVSINTLTMQWSNVRREPGATGSMTLQNSDLSFATVQQEAGAVGGQLRVLNCPSANLCTITQAGPGQVEVTSSTLTHASVTNTATATRGLNVQSSSLMENGEVRQESTFAGGTDSVLNTRIASNSTVVFRGANRANAGSQALVNRCDINCTATVNVTDPSATGSLQNSHVQNGSVTLPAGAGLVNQCRFKGVIDTGPFTHGNVIIEGLPAAVTLAASQDNRLANLGFSNIIT